MKSFGRNLNSQIFEIYDFILLYITQNFFFNILIFVIASNMNVDRLRVDTLTGIHIKLLQLVCIIEFCIDQKHLLKSK